jgi:hypothetical protein
VSCAWQQKKEESEHSVREIMIQFFICIPFFLLLLATQAHELIHLGFHVDVDGEKNLTAN